MLTQEQVEEIKRLVQPKGRIRKTAPKVSDDLSGCAKYVWRMVMFTVSENPQHWCMPVCAEFSIPKHLLEQPSSPKADIHSEEYMQWLRASRERRKQFIKELDAIVEEIVASVPRELHHGTKRWAGAFGRRSF